MAVRLGDTAPDFTAPSTQGEISFHEWKGDSWAVLFSHPADFTPVCTTELGAVARLKGDFAARDTKVIGLSVDAIEDQRQFVIKALDTQCGPVEGVSAATGAGTTSSTRPAPLRSAAIAASAGAPAIPEHPPTTTTRP